LGCTVSSKAVWTTQWDLVSKKKKKFKVLWVNTPYTHTNLRSLFEEYCRYYLDFSLDEYVQNLFMLEVWLKR
jgi:hypothetical protein